MASSHPFQHPAHNTVESMPRIRPGWTLLQTFDLRVAAIGYLRMMESRSPPNAFHSDWTEYWDSAYGIPDPDNWDDVDNYEEYVEEYRRRIFRAIRWYASGGRFGHNGSASRQRRIRTILSGLVADLRHYRSLGISLGGRRAASEYRFLFEETMRECMLIEFRELLNVVLSRAPRAVPAAHDERPPAQ
ncbi:hypothetical protein NMY22_g3014 [Coprinellus aureogranulatus]|nr:hypothetical protein NMY22_g3014 [Coprinellus aureogranulatus]